MIAAGPGTPARRRRHGGLTVAGIARLAGVSAPTVSRVINGQSGVALSTRQRVESVIREHGYRRAPHGGPVAILELGFHPLERMWGVPIIPGARHGARRRETALGPS